MTKKTTWRSWKVSVKLIGSLMLVAEGHVNVSRFGMSHAKL